MGETHEREEPMRANFNRQARRTALCIRARGRRGHKHPISPGRVSLTACDDDLVVAAERIQFELPADLVDLLSPACLPTPASLELSAAVRY